MTSPISSVSPIPPIAPVGGTTSASSVSGAGDLAGTGSSGFGDALGHGLDAVNKVQNNADSLALQAATGQDVNPAAVTVAMTQAQLMTQLMATVQSKAVTSFNTIMGMQA